MDNLQEDPEAIGEITPLANKLHTSPQVTLAIALTCVTIISIVTTITVQIMHSRYRRNQKRSYVAICEKRALEASEEGSAVAVKQPCSGVGSEGSKYATYREDSSWDCLIEERISVPRKPWNPVSSPKRPTSLSRPSSSSLRHSVSSESDYSFYSGDGHSTIVEPMDPETAGKCTDYGSDKDDLLNEYYGESRDGRKLGENLSLPMFRPTSAFSLGGLLDMYMGSPSLGGMGSPVDPLCGPQPFGNLQSFGPSTRTPYRQPAISPISHYPSSRFSVTLSPHDQPKPAHWFASLVHPKHAHTQDTPSSQQCASLSLICPTTTLPHTAPAPRPPVRSLVPKPELGVRRRPRGASLCGEIMRMGSKLPPCSGGNTALQGNTMKYRRL